MKNVHDIEFKQYGRALDVDTAEFVATMKAKEAIKEGVVYEPSDADLEALPLFKQMQDEVYGGLEVEFGFCSGYNNKLNAVEYHRSSEIDIAATDLILMLGRQQDIDYTNNTYETKNIECFFVPAGTAVSPYTFSLHLHAIPLGVLGHTSGNGLTGSSSVSDIYAPSTYNSPIVYSLVRNILSNLSSIRLYF